MKSNKSRAAVLAVLCAFAASVQGATFNYHGNLQDAGKPAQGNYDLELTLYSAAEGGHILAGPLLMYQVPVHGGSFSTEADFGPLANASGQSWLGVKVRHAGNGDFAALSARASIGADATATGSTCPGSWSLYGNAGNTSDLYLGTADAQPVVFKVNGQTAGQISPGKGVYFGQGTSFLAASANGLNSFAMGEGTGAGGEASFAGGVGAFANQAGSYMWGDDSPTNGIIATTAPNQYVVRAGGGVGINGAPKDNSTELTIYPSTPNGGNFSEIFMGGRATIGGVLLTAAAPSAATSNDATFYLDQYDGTHQARKLIVNSDGLSINGANAVDSANHQELTILSGPNQDPNRIRMDFIPGTGSGGYFQTVINTFPSSGSVGQYFIRYFDTGNVEHDLLTAASVSGVDHITIDGDAFKPGGGAWSSSSDRRIKQDIAPIASAIDTLLRLRPVSFRYTPQYRALEGGLPDRSYLGFVAQEFAEIFPDAVSSTGKKLPGADPNAPILALDSTPALITAVAAAQELAVQAQDRDAQITRLTMSNANLQSQVAALAARLEAIEAKGN